MSLVWKSGMKKEWFLARESNHQLSVATESGGEPAIGSGLWDPATRDPRVVAGYGHLSRIGGSNLPGPISILFTTPLGVWEDVAATGSFGDLELGQILHEQSSRFWFLEDYTGLPKSLLHKTSCIGLSGTVLWG